MRPSARAAAAAAALLLPLLACGGDDPEADAAPTSTSLGRDDPCRNPYPPIRVHDGERSLELDARFQPNGRYLDEVLQTEDTTEPECDGSATTEDLGEVSQVEVAFEPGWQLIAALADDDGDVVDVPVTEVAPGRWALAPAGDPGDHQLVLHLMGPYGELDAAVLLTTTVPGPAG